MLYNKTTKKIISKKVKKAESMLSRTLGLMFKRQKNVDYCLVFSFNKPQKLQACTHTLFMLFPIDIIYLDKDKRVVEIRENARPFTLQCPKQRVTHFIEFPAGKTKKKIRKRDLLGF